MKKLLKAEEGIFLILIFSYYYNVIIILNVFFREHYQWNMDIWGVSKSTAEAELISSIVMSLSKFGLSSSDVVIKVTYMNLYFFNKFTELIK